MITRHEAYDLSRQNTFGMKVSCRLYVEVTEPEDLLTLDFDALPQPVFVMGGGSNLLFTGDYPGTVLHMGNRFLHPSGVRNDKIVSGVRNDKNAVIDASSVIPSEAPSVIPSEAKESPAVQWISNAWAVFQTFVFITFTRLFFRSGSNLDPALANEEAWTTAKNMVTQIGSAWNLSLIPALLRQHAPVLVVFAVGMLIHWIPETMKRRYRIRFASLPLFLMVLAVFLVVVFVYQFITADLQSFIYFQF